MLWSINMALYDFCFTGVNEIFLHDIICDQFSFVSVPDWGECFLLYSVFCFILIISNLLIMLFKYSIFLLLVHLLYMLVPENCVVRYAQKFMCWILLANTPLCPLVHLPKVFFFPNTRNCLVYLFLYCYLHCFYVVLF